MSVVVELAVLVALTVSGAWGCDSEGRASPDDGQRAVRPAPSPTHDDPRPASPKRAVDAAGDAEDSPGPSASPPRQPIPPPPTRFMGGPEQRTLLERLEEAPIRWFEPVGATSVVFRLVLAEDAHAAYKPRTRQHPAGPRGEVAAYRLGRLLGLDNVPPAITRRVSQETMRERLDPQFQDTWEEIVRWTLWDHDDSTPGAAIHWVPGTRDLGLDREAIRRRWEGWLRVDEEVPAERVSLARDLSNMLAFEYLTGNWERRQRGRIQGPPDSERVLIRDHDNAFATPLPLVLHRRLRDGLNATQKFSRSFVERLARLDEAAIRAELARDPGHAAGDPILTDAQIDSVMDRREAILSYVGALVDAHGEERVLAFR